MKKILITTSTVLLPFLGMAHGGHGHNEGTVLHYFTSYWHILPIAGAVVGAWFLYKAYRTRKNYQ